MGMNRCTSPDHIPSGKHEAGDQKQNDAELFRDSIAKWNAVLKHGRVPRLLWHYTTFEGLNGILQDNALRATFNQALNDGLEWKFGREVVKNFPVDEKVSKRLEPPPSFVVPPPKSVFVTCFCERPDLLSMWRSYASIGGGYCLGFVGPKLDDLQRDDLQVNDFGARLLPVYYGTRLTTALRTLLKSGYHANAPWLFENMIKHSGFREEKEWRIIVPNPPTSLMSFHSSLGSIKASVQIRNPNGDKKLPLKKIVFGPTVRNDDAIRQTLTWMLQKNGYTGVTLEASSIPYRL
jgi:hypothetical protein